MRSLSRIECFNVGCTNEASVTINGDHVCTQCARVDLPDELHKFLPVPGIPMDMQFRGQAPLIDALRASMQIAVACGSISDDQAKLVADHIAELEAAQAGYIPF